MHRALYTRWLLTLAAVALLGAACGGSSFDDGGGGDGTAGDDAGGGTAAGTAAGTAGTAGDAGDGGDGVDLQVAGFASSQAEDDQLRAIIEAYNEQSSNSAEFNPSPDYATTLQAALASGQPPDAFYVNDNQVPDLVQAGVLAPVDDRIEDPDDFYPNLKDAFSIDGTWYCPPKDFSTLALQYNTDLFEQAGLEPPTTWEELRSAAEQLTAGDVTGLVIGPEWFRWGVFALQAGGDIVNEDVTEMTADSDAVREAFTFLEEMFDAGIAKTAEDVGAGWPGEAFGQGKAAMTIEGNWIVPALANDFPDLPFAVAELPEGPAGPGSFSFSVCYAVAQNASAPEASWDLVNFLVSSEQMLEFTRDFAVMPSRPSLADQWLEDHPDLEAFVATADYAISPVFVPGFQAVLDELNNGIQGIAAGNREVDDVLSSVQSAGDDVLGG